MIRLYGDWGRQIMRLLFYFFQYKSLLIDKMENVQIGSVEQVILVVGVFVMVIEDENGIFGDFQVMRIEVFYNKIGVWVIGVVLGEF